MEGDIIPINWEESRPIIKVIGVGGGGGNAVNQMYRMDIKDVCFVVCNTDAQALSNSPVPDKLQLGEMITKGRGAGCDPEIARKAAMESKEKIAKLLGGTTEMVFIIACMGGGTGTGAAPVIAEVAKKMGLLTVGVVTLPFRDEGVDFLKRALEGIQEMQKHVDSLLVIDNEKLYKVFGDLSLVKAFRKVDEVLTTAVKSIAEIITYHGYINVDFADVKMVMKDSGMALMGSGCATGEHRVIKAVEEVFSSPLLNDVDLGSARNILVNITSGVDKGLSMAELSQVMDYIMEFTGGVSNFKRGVVYDSAMGDAIRVTIVVTGLHLSSLPVVTIEKQKSKPVIEHVVLGEDPYSRLKLPGESGAIPKQPVGFGISVIDRAPLAQPVKPLLDLPVPVIAKKGKPALILEPGEKITDFENTPAFIRQQKKIEEEGCSDIQPHSIKLEERNGRCHLQTANSYIHQTQD